MDFNQILLFAGLGLLALIVLFALWGFLGGLKRELKCIAVFIVLLVLFWLVFGDEATLMNAKFGQQVAGILKVQDKSIVTVWDAILAFAKTKIPNGATLLGEGKETYNLLHSVVATAFRAVGLIVGTVAVLVICPIIRFITHMIGLICKGVKKSRAKKKGNATNVQVEAGEEKPAEKVVISSNKTSADGAVITKDENELPVKPASKKRWWGALAGALKGVFVVILVFAPVSGLCTILNTATPRTQAMISDLVSNEGEKKTSNTADMVEMAFDFAEAYNNSAIGKFVESSSYFFGKSFSQSLFDSLLRIETKNQVIGLSDELINIVEAVNELDGKSKLGSWTNEEVQRALGHLKNSKLLVEAMPVAIEYAHEIEMINKLLSRDKADQGTKFLELRFADWDKDLDAILDAVAKAYELNIFPLDEFNYLTMDAEIVKEVVSKLSEADVIINALPIAVKSALYIDVVFNNVGKLDASGIDTIDWKKELSSIANIYEKFQEFGIEELKGIDTNALIKELLVDENKSKSLFELVDMVLELQLVDRLAVPAAIGFVAKQEKVKELLDKSGQYDEFIALQKVVTVNDLRTLVSAGKEGIKLVNFTNYPPVEVDYFNFDAKIIRVVVDKLCTIESLNSIIEVAAHIALEIDAVKNQVGDSLNNINFADINWKGDIALLADIYEAFLDYEFKSMEDITGSPWNEFVSSILEDQSKFNTTDTILGKLASLDVFTKAGVPAIDYIVEKLISEKASEFSKILELNNLTADDWKKDFASLLEIAKAANDIKALDNFNPFDYKNLDLTSEQAIESFKTIIDKVLALKILGSDELKNKLLLASIRQFGWLDNADNLKLDNINWNDEKDVLIKLVDIYSKVNGVSGFDIYDFQNMNYQELLESSLFIDCVVEVLENLVDSNLFLELLPNLINKYLLPMIEKVDAIDDETLVNDILNKVNSEELVKEIIKLIDVVRAVIDLGAFDVKADGIKAIDLTNTEAFKTIIAGIFDSKLIEGNEGRIIRIILKATGILNIEKGSNVYEELVSLDYTNEKEILLNFVDAITPVLKDESFSLVDENGKFKLDLKFWAENERAQALVEGLKQIFGAYGEEGNGSQLVQALLPLIYDKFVEEKNLIPDDFKEIIDELDVTNANGNTLAHDISCLIYVVEQLVKVNAQSYLDKGSIEINQEFAVAINNVIDALHEIELIHGHESATLTWGINYISKQLKLELEITRGDFGNVDWQGQKEIYKEIVNDLVTLFINNNITNVNQLVDVFKDIKNGKSKYVTDQSVNDLLNVLDKIADVQVIDAVLPLGIKYVVKLLDEKGLALDYLNKFTSQELAEDFHQIVKIAHIAVDEGEFVKYYQNNFSNDMALPKEEVVKTIIHEALQLHILADADGRLLTMLYNEYVFKKLDKPENPFFLTAQDFRFETIDWDKEEAIIQAVVTTLYDLLELHNLNKIGDVINFIKDNKFKDVNLLTDETGYIIVDLLKELKDSQLVENVIVKAYEYAIDKVEESNKIPFSILAAKGLTKEDLMSAISPLAEILDIAIEAGALEYVRTKDIAIVDLDLIADIVEKLSKVEKYGDQAVEAVYVLLQFAAKEVNKALGSNITVQRSDAEAINIGLECETLASAIRACKAVLKVNNLVSLNDIINFVKDKKYYSEDFVNNSLTLVTISVVYLQTVQLFLPEVFNTLIDKVTFIDLSFLKDAFTVEELTRDITQLAFGIDIIKATEFVGLAFGKKMNDLSLRFTEYQDLIEFVRNLNLLNKKYPELVSALINKALSSAKLEQVVTPEMFEGITFTDEVPVIISTLVEIQKACENADLQKIGDVLELTKDAKFYENEKYANKEVVYPLIDAIDVLTNLQTFKAMLEVVADIAGDYLAKAKYNLSFIVEGLTSQELLEDIKLALVYAKDAVEIGLLEYLTTKDIVEFDLTKVAPMVEGLYDFNMVQKHAAEALSKVLGKVNELVSTLILEQTMEDLEAIDYAHELSILAEIVTLLDELMEAQVCHSLNDLLGIVKNRLYTQKAFFNDVAYDVLIQILNKVTELETLEVVLPDLIHYAVRTANAMRIDISFIRDDIYTTELQIEDIRTVIKMLDKVYDFGVIDYVFDNDIPEINEVILNEILDEVINLHILDLFFHEFLALGFNKGFKAANMDIIVTKYEFADVTLEHEIRAIQDVIIQLKAFMDVKGLRALSDISEIITRKDYKNEEFYDVAMGEVLANIVSELLDLDSVVVVLPYVLDFGVDKFDKIDLTFLKGNFTKEELRSDIKALAGAIVPVIKAELIGLAFGKDVKKLNLHFAEYGEIVDAIKGLSLLNKKYPELASALINKGLVKIKTEQSVTPEMFEGITFVDEAPAIIAALTKLDEVAKTADIKTVSKLEELSKQKDFYNDEKYANEAVVYPLIDALAALTDLQTLEAMMQVVANIGVEYADKGGFNATFLVRNLTNEQLVSDVKKALELAREAVKVGGLEYVLTKDIANFDPTIVAGMVEGLYDFNILHGNMIEILDIIFTFVNTKVKEIEFDINYQELKDVDYYAEFATIASAIIELKQFMEGLEYTSLSSLMNIVKNKDYLYENFYNETSFKALTSAVRKLADSKVLGALLPDLLDYALSLAYDKGYDVVFLKDKVYTNAYKLEDIKTLANILDKAYDFGAVEYVFNKELSTINEVILNEILEEVGKLHVLDLFAADILALGINKAFEAANMDITVTRDDFLDVVIANEMKELQDIVTQVKALIDQKGLVSVLDVIDYIKAKNYNNKEFFDVETGEILANLVRELADSEIVCALLPKLLDFGIGKFDKLDLSYLKESFTKEELRSDVKAVADAIVPAIQAELVGLAFKEKATDLTLYFDEYKQILSAVQDMNLINKKWPELATTLTKEVLKMLKLDNTVDGSEFAGLTFAQDVPYLLNALDELNVACQKAKVVKVQEIIDIINNKDYLLPKYANEEVVTPILNALEQVVNMANVEAFLPLAMNYLSNKLVEKKIDVAFLFEDLTNSELSEDARLLVAYARDAVTLGALEYLTTKNIANLNIPLAADMVEGLYEFNMIKKHASVVMEKLVETLNSKVKDIQINLNKDDFDTVDFANEFKVLGEIVALFEDMMKAEVCHSLQDVLDIINEKLYNNKAFFNDLSVDTMLEIIRKATELKTVELALPDLVDYLVRFADSKGYDLSFIKNDEYTNEFILEDINTLTYMAKKAYEFGAVDYIFDKEILKPSAALLNAMLEDAINLHILELFLPDLIALGVNKGFEAAKMDITVVRDEFTSVVLVDEIHELQDIVLVVRSLMLEKGLKTLLDITDLIKNKEYNNKDFYDEATGVILADLLNELVDLETVKVLLPKLLDYGIDKVGELDLSFLKDTLTKEELVNDVRTLATVIVPVIKAELIGLAFKENVNDLPLHFAEYKEILTNIQDMYIINKVWPVLASTVTNYALAKMNSIQFVSEDNFAGLTFAMDVPTLLEALDNIELFLQKVNATTIKDVTNIISNKTYKDSSIANKDVVNTLLDAIQKVIDVKNVKAVLPAMLKHTSESLTVKGTEVDYLFAIVTDEEIIEDLYTIIATAKEVVEFGMIEFILNDGEIDVNDFSVLDKAIETIINLHVMKGNQPNVIITLLNKLGVNTEAIDLFGINWKVETENLQALLEATRQLLAKLELNTLSKIKAIDYKKLVTIDDSFNELLDIYSEMLGCVANDQLISEIILPVSAKYLDNSKVKELVALHTIYNTSTEFQSDVLGLQKVIQAIRNLDLNGFLRNGADYPFRDAENIETIINEVFDLYYLNNENRLNEILNFVDSRVSADLSGLNLEGIDLRADKDKFIQIYKHFSAITESQYWTMNKKGDKFDIKLLGSTLVIEHMIDIVNLYMDTTIYDKTNFAILFFALPVIKVVAPNYYNALELDKVTISMFENDAQYLENMIKTITRLDLVKVIEDQSFFIDDVHNAINSILDDLFALEIFAGHGNAFLNELVNDLVNGKTINGVVVPEGTVKFETTSLRKDREQIEKIINELYAFCANENITTVSDFNAFFADFASESFLSKDSTWDMLENIVTAISNMTFIEENGLAIINNIIVPILEQKGSKFAKYLDLTDYTNDQFMNDVNITKDLIALMKNLGVASIIRGEEIAYEKVTTVKAILVGISELHYMETHMSQIIDFVSRRLPFSVEALHSDEFTFKEDMLAISDAYAELVPYLTSSNNIFKTINDIRDFVNGGFKITNESLSGIVDYLSDFADAYDILVTVSAVALVTPELVEFVKTKAQGKGLASVISFDGMSFAEVQNDLATSAELLRNLVDFGIGEILTNKDVRFTGSVYSTILDKEVTRAEIINMMIENIRDMLCLSDRSGLLLEVLALMNVDTTDIDLANVDWSAERNNLETLVVKVIAILEDYDLNTLTEITDYVKSINNSNLVDEIKHLVRLVKSDIENINAIIETLDSSELFNQLFKPLYNKYVSPILSSNLTEFGDLSEYTIDNLDEDMNRLVAITNALVEMKQVPGTVRDNYNSAECIIPTQTIISQFFALNILSQKKQALVNLVDNLIGTIDLSTLDVTSVDLASDGQVFAQYAAEVLVIYKNMKHYGFATSDLANTEMMAAFVTIYNGCVDTDLVQIIANWAFDKYVSPIAEKRGWVSKFETTEETVAQMSKEIGRILEAFLEMGVFSNNGIDFTDQTVTDKLFGIYENVYAFTNQRLVLIDMLKENMEVIGVVPFTYENVLINNELNIMKNIVNLVTSFINNHKNELNANAIDALNSTAVQNEIDAIIERLFDSMIAKQLALPLLNGMTKIYTRDIYEITIFDGMTVKEFQETFMSDLYDLIEKVNVIVSNKKVDYTNVDGIIAVLDIIVTREPFASHLEELYKYVLYILGVDVRDEYLTDIDWATEYADFKRALQEMSDAMTNVSVSDISTMKNNTFLSALANALPHLNKSELLPLVARQIVEALINGMFENGRFSYYINRLYNSSYTNELLMKDYALLPEMIKAVVALGYFGDGINYQELDSVVTMLEVFFKLEFVKGDEVRFFETFTKRVEMIKDYQIDYTVVTDWDAEKVVLINATKEFAALAHMLDINNMNANDFNDKAVQDQFVATIDALSKSIIGQQLVPQLYADKVEPNLGHSDYQGVIDFSNPEFTPDKWASEFEKFFAAYNILQKYQYGSGEMQLVNADALELMTILFGTRDNKAAGIMTITSDPKLWLKRLYHNKVVPVPQNAMLNAEKERDWADEPYRIIDVLTQMENFTTENGVFSYDVVYNSQDGEKLQELLESVNNCVAVREILLPIVLNTMDQSSEITEALANAGLIDDEWDAIVEEYAETGTYDTDYWTPEKIYDFAKVIAETNANA